MAKNKTPKAAEPNTSGNVRGLQRVLGDSVPGPWNGAHSVVPCPPLPLSVYVPGLHSVSEQPPKGTSGPQR